MKRKAVGVLMAAVMGTMGMLGFAQTAQAASARESEACEHNICGSYVVRNFAADHDATYHVWCDEIHYLCTKCDGYNEIAVLEYERHDYENVYDDKGHMIFSYCTVCGAYSN